MFLYIYTHRHLADILFLTQLTLVAQSLDCFPRTFDRVADCCGLLYCRKPSNPSFFVWNNRHTVIGFLSPRHQFLFMVWTSFDHKAHCQTFLLKLFQKKGEHFFDFSKICLTKICSCLRLQIITKLFNISDS